MKFDGILFATDWDRTLFSDGAISDENIKAIEHFKKNGGLFTVCSGRDRGFIDSFKDVVRPNTYAITFNGAFIYNLDTKIKLYEGFTDERLFDILDEFVKLSKGNIILRFNGDCFTEKYTKGEYHLQKQSLMSRNIYKCVVVSDTLDAGEYNKRVSTELELFDYLAARSWPTGLEFFKKCNAKGTAIQRVARAEGARFTVAVGDYENDIHMLKSADIGYAVENALDSVKEAADRVTVGCDESAIAKIIYELEAEIDSGKLVF